MLSLKPFQVAVRFVSAPVKTKSSLVPSITVPVDGDEISTKGNYLFLNRSMFSFGGKVVDFNYFLLT